MAKAKATLDGYNKLPIDAQMAIPFTLGNVPASAWPAPTLSAGVSWGLIIVSGDDVEFSKYGEEMKEIILAHKDAVNAEQDERGRAYGGELGGAYLNEIDKFDIRDLEFAEWDEFLKRVTSGFLFKRYSKA